MCRNSVSTVVPSLLWSMTVATSPPAEKRQLPRMRSGSVGLRQTLNSMYWAAPALSFSSITATTGVSYHRSASLLRGRFVVAIPTGGKNPRRLGVSDVYPPHRYTEEAGDGPLDHLCQQSKPGRAAPQGHGISRGGASGRNHPARQ